MQGGLVQGEITTKLVAWAGLGDHPLFVWRGGEEQIKWGNKSELLLDV